MGNKNGNENETHHSLVSFIEKNFTFEKMKIQIDSVVIVDKT